MARWSREHSELSKAGQLLIAVARARARAQESVAEAEGGVFAKHRTDVKQVSAFSFTPHFSFGALGNEP